MPNVISTSSDDAFKKRSSQNPWNRCYSVCSYCQSTKFIVQERLKRKFDIAYSVACEKLSFKKYTSICALEKKHGMDLGSTYLNDVVCKTFVHFIAEVEVQSLKNALTRAYCY